MSCGLAFLWECKTPQGSSMIQAEKSQPAVFGLRHEHSTSMFAKHVHSQCLSWLHMPPAFLFLIKLFLSCLLVLKKVIYLIYSFCIRMLLFIYLFILYIDRRNVKVIGNLHNTTKWVGDPDSMSDLTILTCRQLNQDLWTKFISKYKIFLLNNENKKVNSNINLF